MLITFMRKGNYQLGYRAALVLLLGVVIGSTGVAAQEPDLITILHTLGFTNIAETTDETFPANTYALTLLAEFADSQAGNFVSFYPVGTEQLQVRIGGPEGNFGYTNPQLDKQLSSQTRFGLAIDTAFGDRWFTETARNSDKAQHAHIFRDLIHPGAYLIGFETLPADRADFDFQDVVLALTPVADPTI
jgi:hypothetical protein